MSLLSAADVASMRATLNQSLPDTAIIKTKGFTDNLGGGGTLALTASGTVDCRIAHRTGTEREIADRMAEDADWMITVPAETDIDTDAVIQIDDRTFEVLTLHAPRSWELSRRIEANEIT